MGKSEALAMSSPADEIHQPTPDILEQQTLAQEYIYERADGTVERATSREEVLAKCEYLGRLAVEAPEEVDILLQLAESGSEQARPEPVDEKYAEAQKSQKDTVVSAVALVNEKPETTLPKTAETLQSTSLVQHKSDILTQTNHTEILEQINLANIKPEIVTAPTTKKAPASAKSPKKSIHKVIQQVPSVQMGHTSKVENTFRPDIKKAVKAGPKANPAENLSREPIEYTSEEKHTVPVEILEVKPVKKADNIISDQITTDEAPTTVKTLEHTLPSSKELVVVLDKEENTTDPTNNPQILADEAPKDFSPELAIQNIDPEKENIEVYLQIVSMNDDAYSRDIEYTDSSLKPKFDIEQAVALSSEDTVVSEFGAFLPEEINHFGDEQPLEITFIKISRLLEMPEQNEASDQIADIIAEIASELEALEQKTSDETLEFSPELTVKVLDLLRYLGYENAGETLLDFVQKYDLKTLIETLSYIVILQKKYFERKLTVSAISYTYTDDSLASQIGKVLISLTTRPTTLA